MENDLKQEFLSFYESEFKPVALKCAEGYKTILRAERGEISEDSPELEFLKTTKDAMAIWNIGLLIGDVESAKFSNGRLNLINSLSAVSGCLNSESYWTNVWNNDVSTDEAKNLKELAPLAEELIRKF